MTRAHALGEIAALAIAILALSPRVLSSQQERQPEELRKMIAGDTSLARRIGWAKLSLAEQNALTGLLARVYASGARGVRDDVAPAVAVDTARGARAYQTRVESADNGVLKLRNGAVLEITSGYLGYVGYSRDVVLFGPGCRVWVSGKRTYRCELLRRPRGGLTESARIGMIRDVKGDGALIVLTDGTMYEVGRLHMMHTGLWLAVSEVLILDDRKMVNLSSGVGDEIIEVTRMKLSQ